MKAGGVVRLLSFILLLAGYGQLIAQPRPIQNDRFWYTVDGQPIYSQGGGIFRFKDPATGKLTYYWYGVHYKEADLYLANPSITQDKATFQSVTCYQSDNLADWRFCGDVLDSAALSRQRPTWVGRLGVVYIKELKVYALFVQHGNQVLIATADKPAGKFSWYRQLDMTNLIGTPNTGDQTVFTDEATGKSYLIYSYGRGRSRIYVSEIGVKDGKIGLLDCTEVYKGAGREGNCMFTYRGKYYMCASNLYGWDGSLAYYLIADNIRGPYKPVNDMQVIKGAESDYAHVSQTGFFVTVKAASKQTVIYCGDRWADFAGNGLGYNVWCPLSFNGDQPVFNSLSDWQFDAGRASWSVDFANNYVKNGSFEADRRHIPSPVKPVQLDLLGWQTTIIRGNAVAIADSLSPQLNYFNDAVDRQLVTGEKSLLISDKVDFERKIAQVITATKEVPLPAGLYRLSAKIKGTAHCAGCQIQLYAKSFEKNYFLMLDEKQLTGQWQSFTLPDVMVKAGKAEIGFLVKGRANSRLYIDDVSLKRE
ncbi:Glycosyl hydrolases family 43 [Arachidicoccus rhizosphaerae]|uniref:Glycosyl hydrolases family 43 n=1 Tax=Arachidicoccus rhizosphaerae TaxID=551991 RepID=A0A1H3VNR5_9BACT|nr:family 43 glycosylhydrolase [Arachidicoccus rhizosphaerae]SDZ76443.1 Glycosyl hydrolases family 43 [Arachidicoccus rhizosphaerae]